MVEAMKILHTSDWHIGRTFHGHPTVDHLREVLDALVEIVRTQRVDVVAVAGDIFDSSTPAAEYFELLSRTLRALREAGAAVVMTSGNHDSATRLGFQSEWAGLAGIHIRTAHDHYATPVTIDDEHGPVQFYGIPFLEPALVRHHYPQLQLRSHSDVLQHVMQVIRDDLAVRGGRSVVLSHCFAVAGHGSETHHPETHDPEVQQSDVERDITAGGIDYVPMETFAGPDYVALGHIHGRTTLSQRVRYSGAPLHYSFSEAHKPRGAWLVELGAEGLTSVDWVDLPVPRRLTVLTGELNALLADETLSSVENDWISAIVTDRVRPLDGMRRLQRRFAHCAAFEHRPATVADDDATSYRERIRAKSDPEIVGGFLHYVRNGASFTEFERAEIAAAFEAQLAAEATA
jgi:exonuclease SbcD